MSVVIITGCSGGFGAAAALAFAANGDTVVATMRDLAKADALRERAVRQNLRIDVSALDVSISESFPDFVAKVITDYGRIDILVNNAGIHRAGALEDVSESDFRTVMETNCIGPLLLTRAVLPQMRSQKSGLIIMMSSLSGIAGLAGDLPYSASKFALDGATEALRHEVDRWGIRVALVQAGLYKTGIMDRNLGSVSGLPDGYPADSPYKPLIEWQLGNLQARLPDAFDPEDVANLFVRIANGNESRLRWPADGIAEKVLETMFAQSDEERDKFLVEVSETGWWSRGAVAPGD